VSDRVPDLGLGGHLALGPWRVRRAGYGAKQLAGDGGFGAAWDREAERSCRSPRSCPTRVWWCRSCRPCQYSQRSVPGHQDDADIPVHLLIGRGRRGTSRWRSTLDLKGPPE
jgi:hypothetical protein